MIEMELSDNKGSVEITVTRPFPDNYPSKALADLIKRGHKGLCTAYLCVELADKDTPALITGGFPEGIPPDYVDEIVNALYDARRIAKGTLKVL
jgi:hypothetical protein